jgi:glycosyltransferase involved in cell wall biosynthesis
MLEPQTGRGFESQTSTLDAANEIAVIVPIYNGRSMLEELYTRLVESLSTITEKFIIVLVDDAAPDDPWPLIAKLARSDLRVKGIRLSRNFGQHYALTAGIDMARAHWYILMDCDLQDAPEDIRVLYDEANKGHDVVIGVRRKEGHGLFKRWCSRCFYAVFHFLSGVHLDARVGNYRIFSNRVAEGFRSIREQLRFVPASFEWMGFDPAYVELPHHDRRKGQSSYTLAKLFKLAANTILAHSQMPLKMVAGFGIVTSTLTFVLACVFFSRALIFGTEVVGWASLMVTILFVASLQIALMGIMGIYIGKTFEEAKRRPLYIIKDTVNLFAEEKASNRID